MSTSAAAGDRWLVIVEEAFVPADAGGRVETLNLIRAAAAAGVDVTVVIPGVVSADEQQRHRAALPAGAATYFVPRRESKLALVSTQPYVFASRPVPAGLVDRLKERHRLDPWDAVVAVSFRSAPMAVAVARSLGLRVLVRPYNIESDYFEALARSSPRLHSLMYRWEAAKLRRAEKHLHQDPAIVAFAEISEQDALTRRGRTDREVLFVPPFVGDRTLTTRDHTRPSSVDGGPPVVLFLGSLDFANNIDGIRWFARRVWPLVAAATSTSAEPARLQIVGRRAAPALVEEMSGAGAQVLVDVPDVAPIFTGADVFINPVLAGAGVNIKMIEAMAASLPVVSTSVGARGMPWRDSEHLMIADTEADFAAAVVGLLRDPDRREEMARSARGFIADELNGTTHIHRLRDAIAVSSTG